MRTTLLLLAFGVVLALPAQAQSTDCAATYATTAGPIPDHIVANCMPPVVAVPNDGPTDLAAGIHNQGAGAARVVTFAQNAPGTLTAVAPSVNPSATAFINSADFAGNDLSTLYFLSNENHLRSVNMTTGAVTTLPNATAPPGGQTYVGMGWDYTTDQMLVIAGATGSGTLGSIDLTTGVMTTIAPITSTATTLWIDIAIHPETGVIYALDIGTDNLVTIDRTTGTSTVVGPIGFNANFGQGMDFDNDDFTLYHYAVNTTGGNTTGLYTINLTTGTSTLVGSFGAALTQMGDGASMTEFDEGGGGPVIFTSADTPIAIPDGVPAGVNSIITVPPGGPTIDDLDIGFDMTHTWVGDVRAQVTFGATTNAVFDRPGVPASTFGCSGNDADIVIDDEGTDGSVENDCNDVDASPAYTVGGHYTPTTPLSVYDGVDATGVWTLNISDNATPDPGTLNSWSLVITPAGGGPVINTYPGTGLPLPLADGTGSDVPGAPIVNTIIVPPSANEVVDVDVEFAMTHSFIGDLIAQVAHDGTTVVFLDRPGRTTTGFGCGGDNPNIVADDEGTDGSLESSCTATGYPVSGGHYTPNNPLSGFDGDDVQGAWTLTLTDNAGGDTGTLNAWAVVITEDLDTASPGDPTATEASLRVLPNPMSSSGTVELTVPTTQSVRVALYDMLGREVMVVFDREISAAQRALISINAGRLGAGVYVVRATGEDFETIQRVTVTR